MALLDPLVWVADITRAVYVALYILVTLMPSGIFAFLIAFIIGPSAVRGSRVALVMLGVMLTFIFWILMSYFVWGVLPWEFFKGMPTGGVDIA